MNMKLIVILCTIFYLSPELFANSKDSLQSDEYKRIIGTWKLYCTVYKPSFKRSGFSILYNEPLVVIFKQNIDTISQYPSDSNIVTYIYDFKIINDSMELTIARSIKALEILEGTYYFRFVESHLFDELLLTNKKSSIVYILRKPRIYN